MVNVIFNTIRNCSKRKEFAPSGSKFFPFKEVAILKKDAIAGRKRTQQLDFDGCTIFSVLATPLFKTAC